MSNGRFATKISHGSKLSAADFSARIVAALHRAAPGLTVGMRGSLILGVHAADAVHWTEDLTRAYDVYSAEPSLLDDLVRLRVASMLDMATLATVQPATDLLLPVLRRREDIDGSEILCNPYAQSLLITWLIDDPRMPQSITQAALDRLGINDHKHAQMALANLACRIDEISIESVADGVMLVASDTLPASSLLLLTSFWTGERFSRLQSVSVIAPDRSTLLVFDGADARARSAAVGLGHEMFDRAEHPLSVDVITCKIDAV